MLTSVEIRMLMSLISDEIEDPVPEEGEEAEADARQYRAELSALSDKLQAMLTCQPVPKALHVVSVRYAGSSQSYYKLVRVAKSDPHQAAAALELAMKEIPSAVEGRYVRPANEAQIASANAEHNLNRDIIDIN